MRHRKLIMAIAAALLTLALMASLRGSRRTPDAPTPCPNCGAALTADGTEICCGRCGYHNG